MLEEKRLGLLCITAILTLLLSNMVLGVPDESYGVVTRIVDGGSFDIQIEKADPRIDYSTERITLADIDAPDLGTADGLQAKDLAAAVLLNRRVFLDINNKGNGRDPREG